MVSSMMSFACTSVESSFPRGTASSLAPEYSRMACNAFPYRRFNGQMSRRVSPPPTIAMPARRMNPQWIIRVLFIDRRSFMTLVSVSITRQNCSSTIRIGT